MHDLKYAIRQLFKYPGFTAVAVITLALGMGATTAIFSVVYAVVLRALPFPESERLVAIWTKTPQLDRLKMAASNHRDLQLQNTAFEDIAIFRDAANYRLTGDGEPERLVAVRIAANLFPLLRVKPVLGRGFSDDENQSGRDRVVILSHGLWQRRYAGDPSIIGKAIHLQDVPHIVVGVMGSEFKFPKQDIQVWIPLTIDPENFQTRTGFGHHTVARLKSGVTLKQAQSEVNVIAMRLAQEYPDSNKDVRFSVTSLRRDFANVAQTPLIVLLGAALGLLLIGCCNLGNLLLARGLTRSRETAVRSALGASQTRLIRQAAVELVPIWAFGSLLGVMAAKGGIHLFIPWLPSDLPRVEEIEVNLPVLLFSAVVLILTCLFVLMLLAMHNNRSDLIATLREDSRTSSGTAGKATIRNVLVVGQVALTIILLTGAGLLTRSFAALKDVNPGFRSQGVLSLRLEIPRTKYDSDEKVTAYCQSIMDDVRVLPGVAAAGMSNRMPLGGPSGMSSVEFERADQEPGTLEATDDTTTTPDYFRAMGIPLLEGRSFSETDTANAPLVVIVDEQVARVVWPGETPIGKRMRSGPKSLWAEVVGVVGHIRHESLESDKRLQIYWNYRQRARDNITLVVRTEGDARLLAKPILGVIKRLDPDQPVAARTMTDILNQTLALRWFNTVVVAVFAAVSLFLATIGIYGVVAWSVKLRTREIGVRLALGAQRSAVLSIVLRSGLKLIGFGIVLGMIGAMILTRLLSSLLFGVTPIDPLTFVCVPSLLVAVALLACWLPARRAVRIDPMVTLRCE